MSKRPATKNEVLAYGTITLSIGLIILLFSGITMPWILYSLMFIMVGTGMLSCLKYYS